MRQELNGIKDRLGAVESRLGTVEDRVGKAMIAIARLTGDVAEIKQTMATKDDVRNAFSMVIDRIDQFAPWIAAAQRDRDTASHSYMEHQRQLEDHEKRLAKLEGRKPDVGS